MNIPFSGIRQALGMALIVSMVSCGSETQKAAEVTDTTVVAQDTKLLEAVDGLFSRLPKPSAIPNLIALTGAEYESKLVNPAGNADKVMNNSSKSAFNIGIYSADVAYMAAYDKGQDALQTFVVGKKLADKIGIAGAFDETVLGRIEKNLSNKDSLISISDASLESSAGFLKSNDQIKDAALLTAGAFVEGLYLTCGLIHDYPPTGLPKAEQDKILVPLVNTVIKQEATLNSLIELLQQVKDQDEVLSSVISQLESASAIYARAGWAKKMAENKGDLIPTEKDIHELSVAISTLRNGMVL